MLRNHASTPKRYVKLSQIKDSPATSTPRRLSCGRLQVFSQGSIGPGGDGGLPFSSSTNQVIDADSQELSEGHHSCNGSENGLEQNIFSQGPSSQVQSVAHTSEGEHERSTVYYPESSSEPDRNMFGELPCFQGFEPSYQLTSMYQGLDMVNRTNVLGAQARYTLLGQNHGIPLARRHLNFEPMIETDYDNHNIPISIMDPEE